MSGPPVAVVKTSFPSPAGRWAARSLRVSRGKGDVALAVAGLRLAHLAVGELPARLDVGLFVEDEVATPAQLDALADSEAGVREELE